MAYNEEANVGRLLEALVSQRTEIAAVGEIIVVASGCTDGTEDIVRKWMERDPRIRLIVQARREGKASAVNSFLAEAREKVLLVCSADLIPAPDTIEQLVAPFANPEVALATCRPMPVNDRNCFMGFAAHMLWDLHHQINLVDFKAGELIAFRRVFERIPVRTAVDEASVESLIRGQGYETRYVATAVTYNKGPETVGDFLRQRRRIHAGHLALREDPGYRVATLSGLRILWFLPRVLAWRPRPVIWAMAVMILEVWGRFLGWRDYKKHRDHRIWEIATSTKQLTTTSKTRAVR